MKALGSLRELRVLRINCFVPLSPQSQIDMVESLRNLEKIEHLSAVLRWDLSCDTSAWEAAGFLLSERLRQLCLGEISFTRLPSSCINPSRLGYLSHLSLKLDAIDEQELTILGLLPELRFLDLSLKSPTEMECNTTTDAAGDGGRLLFQKLRSFSLNCRNDFCLLLSMDDDSIGFSVCITNVYASLLPGSEWEGVCSRGGLMPTLMPHVQVLSFDVPILLCNKANENWGDGGNCRLCLEDLASLQNIRVYLNCIRANVAEVEEVDAALGGAANVHPNCPKLDMRRINQYFMISAAQDQEVG
nr:unnamed protein product [Digitaria exilis]CAB3492320.1 unnamed protein product [Digitaria exilis]CAB3502781.1 unnamed protein product [Digitaria exilis]